MKKAKRFTVGAVIFYAWYIYTAVWLNCICLVESDIWYTVLKITAPLLLFGAEFAGACMAFWAPFVFFMGTLFLLLITPEFTKKQKIAVVLMPITAYALY